MGREGVGGCFITVTCGKESTASSLKWVKNGGVVSEGATGGGRGNISAREGGGAF
jgi:hypothetical protein